MYAVFFEVLWFCYYDELDEIKSYYAFNTEPLIKPKKYSCEPTRATFRLWLEKKSFWYQKAGVSNTSTGCTENQRSIITLVFGKKVRRHSRHSKWLMRFNSCWRDSLQGGWHQGWEMNWASVSNHDFGSPELRVYAGTQSCMCSRVTCSWNSSRSSKFYDKLPTTNFLKSWLLLVKVLSSVRTSFLPC